MGDTLVFGGQNATAVAWQLEPALRSRLNEIRERLTTQGRLPSREKLAEYYEAFADRFGPDKLAALDGEALLTFMHDHSNRDSLVYWLEFKNDEVLPAIFGSIAGGSALKFVIYRRKETGEWMTGSPRDQRVMSLEEAVTAARKHRDELVRGASLLAQMPEQAGDDAYRELQVRMDQEAPTVSGLAWGHKYFSLIHPTKLDDYHNPDYQRFHLIQLLQTPPEGSGRYICAGRYVALAAQLGLPMNHLTSMLNQFADPPYRYWCLHTEQVGDGCWATMREQACVVTGWAKLPDLSPYRSNGDPRPALTALLEDHYPGSAGNHSNELLYLVRKLAPGDLVVAAVGDSVCGVGRVTGDYAYQPGAEFPHRRPVDWLSLEPWTLPNLKDGEPIALTWLRSTANLVATERSLLAEPTPLAAHAPTRLTGISGRVQDILERKGQVILYGPPGTGKTYWAQLTARALAAQHAFGKPFGELSDAERCEVQDTAGTSGLVRLCTFHPGYGYEDFLEGYRPEVAGGHMSFVLRNGVFKQLCQDALGRPDRRFYLVVDELNRGDVPRIFGELLTLLEQDKRGQSALLPLSKEPFQVPSNVYLIGTMNTADRSIALLDTALRRRFGFIELLPDASLLADAVVSGIPLSPWLDALNRRICEHLGHDARNRQIGHSYLLVNGRPGKDLAWLARVVHEDLIPLLQEYCYEDYSLLERILGAGLLDLANQRVRDELFEPGREADLVQALLTLCPEITTSGPAVASDEAGVDEEAEEDAPSPLGSP